MYNTPILLIVFNRPEETKLVLTAIKKVKPKILYIASDGPRFNNTKDDLLVNQVRDICNNIDWECNVQRLYQNLNMGCSLGPRSALSWFFSKEIEGVVLEDDCLPNKDFFTYCELLLKHYRNDERVLNICGSNMGYLNENNQSYFFSRFMNMSGWATWRRSAEAIDYELKSWKNTKFRKYKTYKLLRTNFFDLDIGWYQYWYQKFNLTIDKEFISWWDWQWIYYQLNSKKLSIIPNKNLVTNIGFNNSATHTIDENNPLANIPSESFDFPISHPKKIIHNIEYEEYAVKWVWCYYKRTAKWIYLTNKIKSFLK